MSRSRLHEALKTFAEKTYDADGRTHRAGIAPTEMQERTAQALKGGAGMAFVALLAIADGGNAEEVAAALRITDVDAIDALTSFEQLLRLHGTAPEATEG